MDDVIGMIESIQKKIQSYKVILVNNFFDEKTSQVAQEIAKKYSCDFIQVDNNGYGAGNNRAVEYALSHYNFDYFVVSNSDISIRKFDDSILNGPETPAIYAPDIVCRTGKRQNPMWVHRNDFLEWLQYVGEKRKWIWLNFTPIIIRKIQRIFFLKMVSNHNLTKIYAAHGAFCIMSRTAIQKISLPYSENMFLFFEEAWLANKAYVNNVQIYYCPTIIIDHGEDGSMRVSNVNMANESRKSVMYYFENRKANS